MNQSIYRLVQNELASFASRTDIALEIAGVRVTLTRRCSPYVSHRGVSFGAPVRGWSSALLVLELRHGQILALDLDTRPGRTWPWSGDGPVPAHLVAEEITLPGPLVTPLLRSLADEVGSWVPLVYAPLFAAVLVHRRVVGWQTEGNGNGNGNGNGDGRTVPVFAEPPVPTEEPPPHRGYGGTAPPEEPPPLPKWIDPARLVTRDDARRAGLCPDGIREFSDKYYPGYAAVAAGVLWAAHWRNCDLAHLFDWLQSHPAPLVEATHESP